MTVTNAAPVVTSAPSTSRGGTLVVAGVLLLATGLGVVGFVRYASSERELTASLNDMAKRGATLTPSECVSAVLDWHAECQAMKSLCDASVYRMTEACLDAGDRSSYCEGVAADAARTAFGYSDCASRNLDRSGKKACAAVYRAVDAHCKSNEPRP